MYFRWDKQYRIICPPPTPKRTADEVKEAREAKRQDDNSLGSTQGADQMGLMYHEYDLMFHYLLASLCSADGVNSVTSKGEKLFDVFAGVGRHR